MTSLGRTDLTPSQRTQLAASALGLQVPVATVAELARRFDVSRPTVYTARNVAARVLGTHFATPAHDRASPTLRATRALLARAVVGLRVAGVNSLRNIEDLLALVYPGVHLSYGEIQEILVEAEQRAAAFNAGADLSRIAAAALDELFSQGEPVLDGVDLDSGYLFVLALRASRGGDDWAEVLRQAQAQGLDLELVVKDAAQGIAKGVATVFPQAEQRDDCFHALYEMGTVRQYLERKAYGAIAREEDARQALAKQRRQGRDLHSAGQQLRRASERCQRVLDLHDAFERATRQAREALEFVNLQTGRRRTPAELQATLVQAGDQMLALRQRHCRRVGRYLKNRAPGLALYLADLGQQLAQLDEVFGAEQVDLACVITRLLTEVRDHRRPWRWYADGRHLVGALGLLQERAGEARADVLLGEIAALLAYRYRASSAIEGFNAAVRPHLYVHRGASQGFLELFRAYYNLRVRRWGRHKGTSAHECLTGERVDDWLTHLGYPPPASAATAN
jgi:transposase-like protein